MICRAETNGESGAAARVLEELESLVARHLPDWCQRGPEDPARVILEAFAMSVAGLREEMDRWPDRLLAELLAELGEEGRWVEPARSAVLFLPHEGLDRAVRVPAGTGITGARTHAGGDARGPRPSFETCRDAWVSPATLRKVLAVERERMFELPIGDGWGDASVGPADSIPLFSRGTADRHIYFGDPAWNAIRWHADEAVLEWPGVSSFVVEGRWEYSVGGGWRSLPVDFEESVNSGGKRVLRMRIFGPLSDLASCMVNEAEFPWIRLTLEGTKRIQWSLPRIAWIPGGGSQEGGAGVRAPRSVARIFSSSRERWQDHSFASTKRVTAARPAESEAPTVYLGWDLPLPASLFYEAGGTPPPVDWQAPGLVWEYSTRSGFLRFEPQDDTSSFSRNGTIGWGLLSGWTARECFGERLFWVRACWADGEYYDVPEWRCIHPGGVEVLEGRTLRDQRLQLSFPAQGGKRATLPLPGEEDCRRFRELDVETEGGDWRRLKLAPGGQTPTGDQFRLRRRPGGGIEVELSEPANGTIQVRLPEIRRGLGVGAERGTLLNVVEAEIEGVREVRGFFALREGRSTEKLEEVCRRVRAEWVSGFRAVVPGDFDRLVRAVDPGLERVEVVTSPQRPAALSVVVFPSPPCVPGRVSPARRAYLERYLQERVSLGTVIRVVEPAYIPVVVDISTEGTVAGEIAPVRLEEALLAFLDPLTGGADGKGYPLGRRLLPGDVKSIMNRLLPSGREATGSAIPGIEDAGGDEDPSGQEVRVLSAAVPDGKGEGVVPFLPDALPVIERISFDSSEDEGT